MTPIEPKLNKARSLCRMAHDSVQLAPAQSLSAAVGLLRQAIEEIADAVEDVAAAREQTKGGR